MDFNKLEKEARGSAALKALASSPEGRALSAQLDAAALRSAVQKGDAAALGEALRSVLSTPEGQALAEKVREAAGKP